MVYPKNPNQKLFDCLDACSEIRVEGWKLGVGLSSSYFSNSKGSLKAQGVTGASQGSNSRVCLGLNGLNPKPETA